MFDTLRPIYTNMWYIMCMKWVFDLLKLSIRFHIPVFFNTLEPNSGLKQFDLFIFLFETTSGPHELSAFGSFRPYRSVRHNRIEWFGLIIIILWGDRSQISVMAKQISTYTRNVAHKSDSLPDYMRHVCLVVPEFVFYEFVLKASNNCVEIGRIFIVTGGWVWVLRYHSSVYLCMHCHMCVGSAPKVWHTPHITISIESISF